MSSKRPCRTEESRSPRAAGQGAREKSNELAGKAPIKTFLSKLIFDVIPTRENAWRIGAQLEEEVGRQLAKLNPRYWYVRHDVMIGRNWNVDHIAVGPPGVFVLDAKFRSGDVYTSRRGIAVDGYRSNMADAVKDQAREVYKRVVAGSGMRGWVQPILVLDAEIRGHTEPDGVHLVGVEDINDYLLSIPRELDAGMLRELGETLMAPRTFD